MNRLIWILAVLVMPLLASADTSDDQRKELKLLEGKWKTVGVEAGGMPLPESSIPDFTISIGPNGKASGQTPEGELRFTITVDPTKKPKSLENLHEVGPEKGKTQYGIYRLEGDKFTVCVTRSGSDVSERPKDFATKDTLNVVFVFERVKEPGKS